MRVSVYPAFQDRPQVQLAPTARSNDLGIGDAEIEPVCQDFGRACAQVPTASDTHFFMWLDFAAPARFFALESASQVVLASF